MDKIQCRVFYMYNIMNNIKYCPYSIEKYFVGTVSHEYTLNIFPLLLSGGY